MMSLPKQLARAIWSSSLVELLSSEMKRYDDDVANRMFDAYCREEWMQEKYVPSVARRHLQSRYDDVHSQHLHFSEYVATGQIFNDVFLL